VTKLRKDMKRTLQQSDVAAKCRGSSKGIEQESSKVAVRKQRKQAEEGKKSWHLNVTIGVRVWSWLGVNIVGVSKTLQIEVEISWCTGDERS
jgi:hypothetical protein